MHFLAFHAYYMGSAVLYTSSEQNVLQTENILDLAGTTIMSFRFLWPYQAQNTDYANQWFTYRYDVRGSVTNITNPEGNQVKGYKYNEFGQTQEAGSANFKNELTFTGSVKDTSTGLQYMNARFYEPQTGRFLSQDTYTGNAYDPWTQHLYAYCANNPTNFVDPTGHSLIKNLIKGTVKIVAEAVTTVAKNVISTIAENNNSSSSNNPEASSTSNSKKTNKDSSKSQNAPKGGGGYGGGGGGAIRSNQQPAITAEDIIEHYTSVDMYDSPEMHAALLDLEELNRIPNYWHPDGVSNGPKAILLIGVTIANVYTGAGPATAIAGLVTKYISFSASAATAIGQGTVWAGQAILEAGLAAWLKDPDDWIFEEYEWNDIWLLW